MTIDGRRAHAVLAAASVAILLTLHNTNAEQLKSFPKHWGEPPAIQTHDYVEWPAGYGHGSGTVARWIADHMAKENGATPPAAAVLYSADFSTVKVGELPGEFMVLNGDFTVQEEAGVRFVELPGAPVESFALMFGPAGSENMRLTARIFGTSKGRRYPAFTIGLNGLGGYRLNLAPGKRALELFRGPEDGGQTVATIPFGWQSGQWANLSLQVRQSGETTWHVEGKAWMEGSPEPTDWMVMYEENEKPLPGRPFVAASPFSGTPIRFNGLMVKKATK